MKMKKSSWHHRLLKKLDLLRHPAFGAENLCPYCWKVVFAVVILPIAALGATAIVTVPFTWTFLGLPVSLVIFIGLIEVVALIIALGHVLNDRFEREIEAGTRPRPVYQPPKPPGLFRLWLKARHEQVCPIIDFVDD